MLLGRKEGKWKRGYVCVSLGFLSSFSLSGTHSQSREEAAVSMFNSGIYHVLRLACRWHGMLTNLAGGILRVPHSSRACVRGMCLYVSRACLYLM